MTNTPGARVREMRSRAGMSQVELAQKAGLSDAYVSLVESGKRTASAKALGSIAIALGTAAGYLQDGEDGPDETLVRNAIATILAQLTDGHTERAAETLATIDPGLVSHANRLDYFRATGRVYDALGDMESAIPPFERALDEARASGAAADFAEIGMWLVATHHDAGHLSTAARVGQEILAEVETLGIEGTDQHLRLASTLMWAVFQRGDHLYGRVLAARYSSIAERVGSARGRGSVLWNAALIVLESGGEQDEAVRLAQVALDAMLEGGSARDVPRLRYDYATILLKCSPPRASEALVQLDLAEEQLSRFGSKLEVARCAIERARACMWLGELDQAEDLVTRGLADLTATGTLNLDTCHGFTLYGDLACLRGDIPLAVKRYGWAADRLSMMSATRYAGEVWTGLARRLHSFGMLDAAIAAYSSAMDVVHLGTPTWPPQTPASKAVSGQATVERPRTPLHVPGSVAAA